MEKQPCEQQGFEIKGASKKNQQNTLNANCKNFQFFRLMLKRGLFFGWGFVRRKRLVLLTLIDITYANTRMTVLLEMGKKK